jgi:hypothetical protein
VSRTCRGASKRPAKRPHILMFSSNSYNNGRRRSVVLNGVPIDITVYQLVYGGYHVIITFNGMIFFST